MGKEAENYKKAEAALLLARGGETHSTAQCWKCIGTSIGVFLSVSVFIRMSVRVSISWGTILSEYICECITQGGGAATKYSTF